MSLIKCKWYFIFQIYQLGLQENNILYLDQIFPTVYNVQYKFLHHKKIIGPKGVKVLIFTCLKLSKI